MSDQRFPLRTAERIAHSVYERLRGTCDRIEIAGSIRRRANDVKDGEIVAIPTPRTDAIRYRNAANAAERAGNVALAARYRLLQAAAEAAVAARRAAIAAALALEVPVQIEMFDTEAS